MNSTSWEQLPLDLASPRCVTETEISPPGAVRPDEIEAHRKRVLGYLTMRLPDPVDLVFTNNRSTMISVQRKRGRLAVRLHRLFRHADETILSHLSNYLISPKKIDSLVLDRFIARHQEEIVAPRPKPLSDLAPQGKHHDLQKILNTVNREYFKGNATVRIGWGNAPRRRVNRRRRRSMSRALATYYYNTRTIRVSPVLDAKNVPTYVIEWIVYHELLHHVLPIKKIGGKHIYHSKQFRALERAFVHYEKAKAWEESHLDQLLL
jgi:predicted metal-dependent hydrolase